MKIMSLYFIFQVDQFKSGTGHKQQHVDMKAMPFLTLKVALTQVWTEAVEDPRMSGVMSGLEDSWLSSWSQAL